MASATGVPSKATTTTTDTKDSNPSIISGHVQYAKGYAEETIGKVTGSKEWVETGKKDTEQAIQEMKEAGKNKGEPDAGTTVGKVEEVVGQVTGCEGMEGEGKERISKATSGNPAQSIG